MKALYRIIGIAGIFGLLMNAWINSAQAWIFDSNKCIRSENSSDIWQVESPGNPWNIQVSGTQSDLDNKLLRFELRNTDAIVKGGKRCEISGFANEKQLQERWYSFSVYLPSSGSDEYLLDPDCSEIIAQWHNVPDPGEKWTKPPLALRTIDDYWRIDRAWDANPLSTSEGMEADGHFEYINLGSYLNDKGKWTDWTFHVKWGWLPEHKTVLEIYKDGELVLERNGLPNTTNDQVGVVQKLGIYKWDWIQPNYGGSSVCKRVVYYYDGSILKEQYFQALQKLVDRKIILTPDYWTGLSVNNLDAKGNYISIIMMKITGKNDIDSAIECLASTGVISDPDYWLHNCKRNNEIKIQNVQKLIINAGNKIML